MADRDLSELPVALLSDALDAVGIAGQVRGIRDLSGGGRLAGPAFTVRFVPVTGRGGTVGDYIDEVPAGSVVVLDNGGRTDVTVWGDLLTERASAVGVAGTVIHGACRDAPNVAGSGYPIFARVRHMRTGRDRVRAVGVGEAISLGTAAVCPGDLVVGDADGVVVIPHPRLDEVRAAAELIRQGEETVRRHLARGAGLDQARKAAGYHNLHRREGDDS